MTTQNCRRSSARHRLVGRLFALLLVVGGTAALSVARAERGDEPSPGFLAEGKDQAGDRDQQEMLREGSRLELTGYFKSTGDRMTFYAMEEEREVRLRALENLALQRIARVMSETPTQLEWNISGTITEYRGNNFLLVTKAVLRSRAPGRGRT